MALTYGIIALISLCMIGVCVFVDKKRDLWLLLVFVSVSVCNLGYFMLSVSKNLGAALNSNRISYLGSVFLPFFMLLMLLRFCGIQRKKTLTITLVVIGVLMLAITTSPGILPIYYSTVDIEIIDGTTKLVREYGPLHNLYYVYLIGYMLSMVAVVFYAIKKKKIQSQLHAILLLSAVFCNILIWLAEQYLPRGFEWLSISYILTECLILVLYHLMQRQGLMSREERTHTYTINLLLALLLLFFANFLRVVTTDAIPATYVISHIVVLMIYIGLLISWAISAYDRILNRRIRRYIITLVGLMLLWILMRTLRHTVFLYVFPWGQWCWYAYYISMILIPQFCLFAAKYVGKQDDFCLSKKWYLMYIPSLLMIGGILTNDLHQSAFYFHQGYEAGWDIYQHKWLYYVATIWIFTCIALMIAEFVRSCRIPGTHKMIWLPITMLGVGVLYSVLYAVNTNFFRFIEMTAALCFTVVAIWESSIKTGLIPSNTHYDNLLKYSGMGVVVVDHDYNVHYCSDDMLALTKEQMEEATKHPIMLEDGIRVSSFKIRGGYTMWQEDLSDLMDILDELTELREELKDSNIVSMKNYQMEKQIRMLAEKNRLHDELHKQTAHQINLLNKWLKRLMETEQEEEKQELLRRIVVVGAYLKRRNNLILINEQDGIIREKELELSIQEMMRNLQLAGVNCACAVQLKKDLPADVAMKLFDFYEYVVENTLDRLECLLARFFYRENRFYCCIDMVCNQDLSTLQSDSVSVSISDENNFTLSFYVEGGGNR